MDADVMTIGTITILRKPKETFEGHTTGRKISIGEIIPFHVTDDKIDIRLGYAIFINRERDVRVLEVQKDFDTFGRLKHGLRLAIQPVPGDLRNLYVELKQAIPKHSFESHQTLYPTTSEVDLDDGAQLPVFEELRKAGATVGTRQEVIGDSGRRAEYLCASFPKDNVWVPVLAYTITRILPISLGYQGYITQV